MRLLHIRPGDGLLTLVFEVLGRPDQLGRQIEYALPALLAPASPLAGWLSAALGIHLSKGESIDLEQLTGRVTQTMFAKPGPDGTQAITHWRAVPATPAAAPATEPANRPATTARPVNPPVAAPSAAQTAKPAGPTSAMSPPATTPSGGRATGGTASPASTAAKGVGHV